MKVVVTGASGFIGRSLCATLVKAGHEPVKLDAQYGVLPRGDVVVHLAGIAHRNATPEEFERVNVRLARGIAEAAASQDIPLVFLSSVKVHGDASPAPLTERSPIAPRDAYAESKARAEEALRAVPGLRLAVLRPPLVYGPGVKANFLALMRAIARGVPLPLASVRNRRSFVYLDNLVDAIVCSCGMNGTFLVSDGAAVSTADLCQELGQALGRPARLFAFPPRWLPEKLVASLEVDDSAFRAALGWRPPYSRNDGLRQTAAWYLGR